MEELAVMKCQKLVMNWACMLQSGATDMTCSTEHAYAACNEIWYVATGWVPPKVQAPIGGKQMTLPETQSYQR